MTSDRPALFNPDEPAPAAPIAPGGAGGARGGAMSVSALIARIKGALADAFPKRVTVLGEISNFKRHSSGHMYFRLKDANAAIDAAMFCSNAARLKFAPEDGMEVVVDGRVDVYDVRGQLQIYVQRMTPRGEGALELAFRQLCEKLRAEGLFDEAAKKPIPRFPRAIGVVTSPTGAAIRDIRRTLRRRWPAARVYLVPTPVQGEGAAEAIAEGVTLLDAGAETWEIDTIIVARGGGSLEDLWAFNTEPVARAIFAAATPVISGVGHEIDVTIADMAADIRAATPTAAAELAVPDVTEVRRILSDLAGRMTRWLRDRILAARSVLRGIGRSVVFRDPGAGVRTRTQRIDELSGRLAWALGGASKRAGDLLSGLQVRFQACSPIHRLALARQKVNSAARQLAVMSHRAVFRRGFSLTRGQDGRILRSAGQARPGDTVETELADGRFKSVVGSAGVPRRKKKPPSIPGPGLFE